MPGAALGTSPACREAGLEEAQPWGQPTVGEVSIPPSAGTGVQSSSDTALSCLGWAGGWKLAVGIQPRNCFGAEWAAAGVFRGLETLPLHRTHRGGWGGSPVQGRGLLIQTQIPAHCKCSISCAGRVPGGRQRCRLGTWLLSSGSREGAGRCGGSLQGNSQPR